MYVRVYFGAPCRIGPYLSVRQHPHGFDYCIFVIVFVSKLLNFEIICVITIESNKQKVHDGFLSLTRGLELSDV